jgi:carboxypeptidase C (cathepsin A)
LQYATILPDLLDDGVRGMIYAGDQDLICNWLGNRRWVDALQWSGADAWADAHDLKWAVNGTQAGEVRESGALAFVKVFGAGHMVRARVGSCLILCGLAIWQGSARPGSCIVSGARLPTHNSSLPI